MCDWKPGPRCFTHYEPRYRAALDAYSEALRKVRVLAESGKLTDADRLALQNAFEDYQTAQRMFFMSPKARKKYLGDEIATVRENLESAKEHLDEPPMTNTLSSTSTTTRQSLTSFKSRPSTAITVGNRLSSLLN